MRVGHLTSSLNFEKFTHLEFDTEFQIFSIVINVQDKVHEVSHISLCVTVYLVYLIFGSTI